MTPDPDFPDDLTAEPAAVPPSVLSTWLAEQDVVDLATFARAARLSGSSFMTHVRGSS